MRRILIIGGGGYIGEYVVGQLAETAQVTVVHRHDIAQPRDKIRYLRANLERDINIIGKAIENADAVLWLVRSETQLLERFTSYLQESRLELFLLASTVLLYADSSLSQPETAPVLPQSPYERIKYAEEQVVRNIFASLDTRVCIARLSNVYGGMRNAGIVGRIFRALASSSTFSLRGDGSQRRDFIHVEDVARLLSGLTNATQNDRFSVFNISSGVAHSVREVIEDIERLSGKKLTIQSEPAIEEKAVICADNRKILEVLAERIIYPLQEGLRHSLEGYPELCGKDSESLYPY